MIKAIKHWLFKVDVDSCRTCWRGMQPDGFLCAKHTEAKRRLS